MLLVPRYWRFALWVREQVLGGKLCVEDQVEEADHHFVPILLAPDYGLGGVWVLGIVWGVVEVRGALDLCSFGKSDWLGEVVPELPVPVVGGDLQDGLRVTVREYQTIFEVFAASVHVRMKANELDLSWHFEGGVDTVVWISWRNSESTVHRGEGQDAFFWRLLRKD